MKCAIAHDDSRLNAADLARVAAWGGLLLVEILGLSIGFDFGALWEVSEGQCIVLRMGQVPRVAVAGAVAALLHGGWAWQDEVKRIARTLKSFRHVLFNFIPHLVAFILFSWDTARLTSSNDGVRAFGNKSSILIWTGLGLAVALSWLVIALPPRQWAGFARRRGSSVLGGLLIGLLAGIAGVLTTQLWKPMAGATLFLVKTMISPLVGDQLVNDPAHWIVGTQTFSVSIAPECSGYEGIGLIWVILGAYLWLFRRGLRFPQALVLLPIGTAFIWLANSVRIAGLVMIGNSVSPGIAAGGFHSQAGWLALNAVILGLIAVSRQLGWIMRTVKDPESHFENPSAAYLAPLMALMTAMMIGAALSEGFDWLYGLRVIAVIGVIWIFRAAYRSFQLSASLASVGLGIVVLALWLALEPPSRSSGADLAANLATLSPFMRFLWIAAKVVGSTLLVPFAEELAFRGYLARRMMSAEFEQVKPSQLSLGSILGSSLLFGAMHQRFIAGMLAGLIFAYAYRRRGSLGDAILAHATTNGLIAVLVLAGGWWSLWS